MRPRLRKLQRGLGIIAAIVILVIMAVLGTFIVVLSTAVRLCPRCRWRARLCIGFVRQRVGRCPRAGRQLQLWNSFLRPAQ